MESNAYKLIVIVVARGKAGKVADIAHDEGIPGATILPGHGSSVRLMLGISVDPEKDIVLIVTSEDKAEKALAVIAEKMEFNEPHHGFACVLSLDKVIGLEENFES
ncbi:MAG: hypothetical protein FWG24_03105 [Eggerthellaceae bacterium]|nr:hypothetical protein [Eggerthellaceae bacterium]